jgi:CRISPR-associated endonuclease/helicase Cas3
MWRTVISVSASTQVAQLFRLSAQETENWVIYLAALHDLGKASPAFQMRREAHHLLSLYTDFGQPPNMEASECPHGRVTAGELPAILESRFAVSPPTAKRLAVVIGGHHGVFPTNDDLMTTRYPSTGVGRKKWQAIREELAVLLAELFGVLPTARPQSCDHAVAMYLAGLVSVADWIGSNNDFFPYLAGDWRQLPTVMPQDYLRTATEQAKRALRHLGWSVWRQPEATLGFSQLFPFLSTRRPIQEAAIRLARKLSAPGLVIIEAPMGEGKTEAALQLADGWGVAPGPRGCYFALPTQATSNQMFTRLRDFLATRYSRERVNLQLLHGHAALSAEFERLRLQGDQVFSLSGVYGEDECGVHGSTVVAAEWFTHRKRGLLAPFGVGTVDQALLAALQTRHVFVRLFGLAHKVIIVDEVHAYDAYMSKLLERLLEWLAALGSPVVLLSATLPDARRKELLKAYLKGLNRSLMPDEDDQLKANYPRVTFANAKVCGAQSIEVSPRSSYALHLEWISGALPEGAGGDFPLGEKLHKALVHGGCAAVICNTVTRAQQVYRALKSYFADDELNLFHARFLFKDRDAREKRVLLNFGKPGSKVTFEEGDERAVKRPHRAVLVATQVVEQSLDLDFDLMT